MVAARAKESDDGDSDRVDSGQILETADRITEELSVGVRKESRTALQLRGENTKDTAPYNLTLGDSANS